jgi:hypothetical protein
MTFREIPSIKEVKEKHINLLLTQLEEQLVFEEAAQLIAQIGNEKELLADIACRAISALMEKRQTSGPDRIGLGTKEVDRLMTRSRSDNRRPGKPRSGWQKGRPGQRSGRSYGSSSPRRGHKK